jgi:hypothetical protein
MLPAVSAAFAVKDANPSEKGVVLPQESASVVEDDALLEHATPFKS